MWTYDDDTNEYIIEISELIAGNDKDYLLELEIPPFLNISN